MDKQPKYGFRKSKKGLVSGIIATTIFGVALGGIAYSADSYDKPNKEIPTYDVSNWTANTVSEIEDEIENQLNNNRSPEGISDEEAEAHDWYEIRWGDTVWGITSAHGIDLEEFARRNGIENADLIYAGDWVMLDITQSVDVNEYEDAELATTPQSEASLVVEEEIHTTTEPKEVIEVVEEPVYREPAEEVLVEEDPIKEEPIEEEPVSEEPVEEEPVEEEPVEEEPAEEEPVEEEPVEEEPVDEEPVEEEPVEEEPEEEEPVEEEPVEEEPEEEEPVDDEPEEEAVDDEPEEDEPEEDEPEEEELEEDEPEDDEPEEEAPEEESVEKEPEDEPEEEEPEEEESPLVTETETRHHVIEYQTEYILDENLAVGEEEILTEGVHGETIETYEYTYIDGELISEELIHTETVPAVNKVVATGPEEEPDPLVYSAHAIDDNGSPLINENIHIYDSDLLIDTTETDDIGYFITHLLPDIMYDIQGDGYHAQVEGTEKDEFIVDDIEGETKVGRTVTTEQSEINFKPSAKVYDLDASEVTFSPDESSVIIDQVLDINIGDTIYITPEVDYLTGQVFNVDAYETNGYETLIYTTTTTWEDLVEYIQINTGDQPVSVGDMEVYNESWVTVDRVEIENSAEDVPNTISLFSSEPNLDEKIETELIFNVDFNKLFEQEFGKAIAIEDYTIKLNEFELTKDPIVIPVGNSEFLLYGNRVELVYDDLVVGLDHENNFKIDENDNYIEREDDLYKAKFEDREIEYNKGGRLSFVDGDLAVNLDNNLNFQIAHGSNLLKRNGSEIALKYNPFEFLAKNNQIIEMKYENREVVFDENGRAEFVDGANKLTVDRNNFNILLQMGDHHIQLNTRMLEFSDGELSLSLNDDSSLIFTKGTTSLQIYADQPNIIVDLDGNRLEFKESELQLSRGEFGLSLGEDSTIGVSMGSDSIKLTPEKILEIVLNERDYQIELDSLKDFSMTHRVKDFDLTNESNKIYEYLKNEVDKTEKDEVDFDEITGSMKNRFEGSVNTRVTLNGGMEIFADIDSINQNHAYVKQNLNTVLDTNIKLSFEKQDEPYRVSLATLRLPQVPIATLSLDLVFDLYGNMEVITSMGLSSHSTVSMRDLDFDIDFDANHDTAYGSVEGEGSGKLGLDIIPKIGIDHLGADLTFTGMILPNIRFEGEMGTDDSVETSGLVEGKIDGNVRAAFGFDAGFTSEDIGTDYFFSDWVLPLDFESQEDRNFFNQASFEVGLTGITGDIEIFDKTFPIWSFTSGEDAGNYYILLNNNRLTIADFTVDGDNFISDYYGDSIQSDYIRRNDNPYDGDVPRNGTYWIIDLDEVIRRAGSRHERISKKGFLSNWTNKADVDIFSLYVNSSEHFNNQEITIGDPLNLDNLNNSLEIIGLPQGLDYKVSDGQLITDEITLGMGGEYVVYVIRHELITGDATGIGDTVEYHDENRIYDIQNKALYEYYIDSFKLSIVDPIIEPSLNYIEV